MASNMTIILPLNIALYKLQCYSAVAVTVQKLAGFVMQNFRFSFRKHDAVSEKQQLLHMLTPLHLRCGVSD